MKKNKLKVNQSYQNQNCNHLETVFDPIVGEQLCRKCGVVLVEKMIDFASEMHSNSFQNSRVGPKSTLKIHDRGLSTNIGKLNKDSTGNSLNYEMKKSLKRMRIWDSRSKNTTRKRNLQVALIEMTKLAEKLSLSEMIIERASYFYRKVAEKNLIRGRSIKATVGACIHAACREAGTNRTLTEISKNLQENRKNITKTYRVIFQNLDFKVPRADIRNIIVRFSNNLKISEKTKRDALSIFEILKNKEMSVGKKPNGVAAAVIYMATIRNKEEISQKQISAVSGITQITIRNRYKEFKKFIKLV